MAGKSPRVFGNLCGEVDFNCDKAALLDQGGNFIMFKVINTLAHRWLGCQEMPKDLLPVIWFQLETIIGNPWDT